MWDHKQGSRSTKTGSNAICDRQDQQRYNSSSRCQSLSLLLFFFQSFAFLCCFSSINRVSSSNLLTAFISFHFLPFFPSRDHDLNHFKVRGHNSRHLLQRFLCFESISRIHQSFNKYRRKFSISMFRWINSKTKIRRNEDHTRSCRRILF